MEQPSAAADRRAVTPAIVASAVFVAACAVFAIAFIGARGGLSMPLAPTDPPVAVASDGPADPGEPPATGAPTPAPVTPPPPTLAPTVAPTTAPSPSATPSPTAGATRAPTTAVPTLEPGDPLLALPACEDHPACREYVVVRFDTLSSIISRYLLDIDVLRALNPGELDNPNLVFVGQLIYVGRDPLARLDACPNGEACVLYEVQAGESLADIADRYLMTRDAVLEANPGLPRPVQPGQVVRLPVGATAS